MPLRSSIDSDNESEGQGAPAVYEEEVEYEEELYEEGVKEVVELVDDGNEHNLEKKENEPYAVPKAGAFYMHDDRFGDNVGGPHKQLIMKKIFCLGECLVEEVFGNQKMIVNGGMTS